MNLNVLTGGPSDGAQSVINSSIGINYPYLVMAISVISISSDSSEDSVGTPAGPNDSYHIPPLPATSPFLSSDDDPTDSDTPDTPSSPTHDTPFTEITASTQRSPIIPRRRVMLLASGQPIPYGRPYRYHLNGPVHMMTARKRVGPLPTHRLAERHSADHSSSDSSSEASSDFHSDASSDPSSRYPLSDHSSPDLPSTSAGPSRKRHRSPMTSVPALSPVSKALSPVRADLIPSPKRVKDSGYLADVERNKAEIDECFCYADAFRRSAVIALTERIAELRGINMRLEKMPNTRSGASMTREEFEELVNHRVAEENGRSVRSSNGGNRNRGNGNGGNGNGGNRNGRNGNGNGNGGGNGYNFRGFVPARECTYQDFLKCQPLSFNGTEGVVGLTRWFEKIETVFHISNCPEKYQVKYASCTLLNNALTWWNSHKRTIRIEAAYAMSWVELMKLMTEVYCPRNEVQKMEIEMVPNKEDKVERFVGGLPDNIQGNVIAAEPTKLQDAIRIANNLMDQKLKGYARSAENKRRKDFPKLRNQNYGNKTGTQTESNESTTKAYAIRGGGANPDSNVVTGTFLLNNCYAFMLFDSGAGRSFVSSTFSALLDVAPSTLDTSYAVELADGRISETNVVLRGCTLGLLGPSVRHRSNARRTWKFRRYHRYGLVGDVPRVDVDVKISKSDRFKTIKRRRNGKGENGVELSQ
ncbi:hypothetical protein Tco_0551486 [Tanacetum coccineum]